jgi:2,4-dienoyl-CoA reductase-like NADH-dependent reductase (Old Yellow Enzyme family)
MSPDFDTLFRPLTLGSLTLKNRIVMAPMTRSQSPGGVPTEAVAAYYRRRAEGGVGLIVTEGTVIDHPGANGYPAVPRFYGDDALAGWRRVVNEVHDAGGVIIPQIWHVGSVRQTGMEPDPAIGGYGPSAVVHPTHGDAGEVPNVLSEDDIANVVAAYAGAAANARSAGFDGVEIHGAHGYLVDQFLWEKTNQRDDQYGGSLKKRLRFAVEVVAAVRAAVGPDFPVVLRFSQWKMADYRGKLARTPQELESLLLPLSDAGVDIFHASTRKYWKPEFKDSNLNLAGWTKKITGKPTITVGSVGLDSDFLGAFMGKKADPTSIDNLLDRLERDEFDLVAVGRALIADPAWAMKVKEGRSDDVIQFEADMLQSL